MSYLLDKKLKRKKITSIVGVFLIFFLLIYFHIPIFNKLSQGASFIFRPVLILSRNIKNNFSSLGSFTNSKKTLISENQNLKTQLDEMSAKFSGYSSLLDQNTKLKEILGRKKENSAVVVAGILSKINQSIYGTLLIDAGFSQGIRENSLVFALGNVPIGRISQVFPNTSKIVLFSTPGEKNDVIVTGKDVFVSAVGRGGGNFEISLPRDFNIEKGTEIVLPGINNYILATVADVISDPRDSFQKALLVSPVNIEQLRFVSVEK